MSYWQVVLKSAAGQVMTFGLESPDETSAFQHALAKAPFTPDQFSIIPVPPLCTQHRVRHDCSQSVSE